MMDLKKGYGNNGTMEYWVEEKSFSPLFQYCSTPIFEAEN
jgi:hypothetical protein